METELSTGDPGTGSASGTDVTFPYLSKGGSHTEIYMSQGEWNEINRWVGGRTKISREVANLMPDCLVDGRTGD